MGRSTPQLFKPAGVLVAIVDPTTGMVTVDYGKIRRPAESLDAATALAEAVDCVLAVRYAA